jgi:hypothetical protein
MTPDIQMLSVEEMREKSKEELAAYFIELLHYAQALGAIPAPSPDNPK